MSHPHHRISWVHYRSTFNSSLTIPRRPTLRIILVIYEASSRACWARLPYQGSHGMLVGMVRGGQGGFARA